MKKTFIAVFFVFLHAAVSASGNFSLWGGYSQVSMAAAKDMMFSVYGGYDTHTKLILPGSAATAGLDGGYWYYTWWGIGGRVSYTGMIEAIAEGAEAGLAAKTAMRVSLFQVCAGVPLLFELFDGNISVGGGIYAGWGYASLSLSRCGASQEKLDTAGHCLVIEAPLRITWHISSSYLADLNLSYKSARAADMRASSGAYYDGTAYEKGAAAGPEMDFSGIMIGAGFNWRFSSKHWPWYN